MSAPVAEAPTPPVPAPPTGPWTTGPDGHVWTTGATGGGGRAGPVYPGFGPQPRPEPPSNPLVKVLTLGGAAIVVLGSMLTWARVSSEIVDFSASGLDGDGVLTLPGAFGFGVVAASSLTSWSRGRMIAALVVAVLVSIVAAINVADISPRVSDVETGASTPRSASGSGWCSPAPWLGSPAASWPWPCPRRPARPGDAAGSESSRPGPRTTHHG